MRRRKIRRSRDPLRQVTRNQLSRTQLCEARLVAETIGDRTAQIALERILDAFAWPMLAGAVVGVAAVPGVLVAVACNELSNPKRGPAR